MKLFGHPVHVMLIHFPAALFPMELICYFIFYKTGNPSFANAAYYAMFGGTVLGWFSVITGAIDLIRIKDNEALKAKALVHGAVNTTVVVSYSIFTMILYNNYPNLPEATSILLVIKAAVNALMIVGNYLGGNLVLKDKIGVLQPNTKMI